MKNYSSVLIICNPNAMRGNIDEVLPHIKKRLSLRYSKVDSITSQSDDGAEELANKNAGKYDIILSCGGDGTLHQVVNGVMQTEFRPLIGILPFGTCNDVARTLKIPFDLDKAIDCVLRLNTTNYDILTDGDRFITYSLATGYLTKVSYSAKSNLKKKVGRFAYVISALKYIFKFNSLPFTFTIDGERVHGKFSYVMFINSESVGGFPLNKGENLHNGMFKVVLIKRTKYKIGSFFNFLKLFIRGVSKIKKSKNIIVKDAREVIIENHSNEPFALDGEKVKFLRKTISVNSTLTLIKK